MDVPKHARLLRIRAKNLYRSWWCAHYTIGIVGIVCAALLTAMSAPAAANSEASLLSQLRVDQWLLGVLATVCGSLVTLLGPIQKAEKYWAAFHKLDQACMELEHDLIDMAQFAKSVAAARDILQAGGLDTEKARQRNNEALEDAPS